jgi:hypothetical protein
VDDCCKKAPRRARYLIVAVILLLGLGLAAASGEFGGDRTERSRSHCGSR